MTTLSIAIPDDIAKESQRAAKKLGVSRTAFIRQAVKNELKYFYKRLNQEAMARAFVAMKSDKNYLKEAEEIMDGLNTDLPDERDQWWNK